MPEPTTPAPLADGGEARQAVAAAILYALDPEGHADPDPAQCFPLTIGEALDALDAAGYAVVHLPEPASVELVCGCDTPPNDVSTAGCCNECMQPALAFFDGSVSVDLQHGALYDGTGRTFEAPAAELQAARLLAAARYLRRHRHAAPDPVPAYLRGTWDAPGAPDEDQSALVRQASEALAAGQVACLLTTHDQIEYWPDCENCGGTGGVGLCSECEVGPAEACGTCEGLGKIRPAASEAVTTDAD